MAGELDVCRGALASLDRQILLNEYLRRSVLHALIFLFTEKENNFREKNSPFS